MLRKSCMQSLPRSLFTITIVILLLKRLLRTGSGTIYTEVWLAGDHYKWRALRAAGVSEKYITGDASDYEKFCAFAETMPKLLRNPLWHWSHLELSRVFGIKRS